MADGRRVEGHDAELLRRVFVMLSGALAFLVAVLLEWKLRRIVSWVLMAAFFATTLSSLVDALTRLRVPRRSPRRSRSSWAWPPPVGGRVHTFVRPIYDAGQTFAGDIPGFVRGIPGFVERARNGEGRVGELTEIRANPPHHPRATGTA